MILSNLKQPVGIIVRGLPGSGKSRLANFLKGSWPSLVVLDPDLVDQNTANYLAHVKRMTEDGVDPAIHLYRFLRERAFQTIDQQGVFIWNQPFTNRDIFNKMMTRLEDRARQGGAELKLLIIEFEINPELAWQRIEKRRARGGHGPDRARFDKFVADYESFASTGYPTLKLSAVANDSELAEKVQAKVLQL